MLFSLLVRHWSALRAVPAKRQQMFAFFSRRSVGAVL